MDNSPKTIRRTDMNLLYSNILPLGTDEGQNTIIDTFNEQITLSDRVNIAVGYVSRASLDELELLVEQNNIKQICCAHPPANSFNQ